MAHAQQHSVSMHAPLDDDDLRLSLALDALDDDDSAGAHDVDMDMDGLDGVMGGARCRDTDGDDDDMDGFRPSAMLDRRLAEEYGDAFYSYSTCFQSASSELVEKDLAGGFVDIEQMLLNESEEFMTSQFEAGASAGGLDGAVASADQRTMLRAEITARHFRHKSNSAMSNSGCASAANNAQLVLLKQAIASSAVPSSSIFNMPPRYFDTAQSSPQKRRAYRRTFGERAQPFGFDRTNHQLTSLSMKHDPLAAQHMNQHHHHAASTVDGEENRPPPAPTADKVDENDDDDEMVHIKEEIVDSTRFVAARSLVPVAADESMGDEEKQQCVVMKQERVQQPSFTGFRSISDDADEHFRRATTPTPYTPTMDDEATLRTPLRRSVSTPMPEALSASSSYYQHQTPSQQYVAHGLTSRSMSPADAFEKVAVVVQVAKDSPARMNKFEWKIGGSARPDALKRQSQQQQQQRKMTTLLAAELGKVDGDACAPAAAAEGAPLTADSAVLPPRYFRGGVTSSPEKRRVHSTTFGSFARSFSFTGNAPQS